MKENIVIKNELDEESILIYHKRFNRINNCSWTIEQFKQSLKNQDYLNHFIFYKDNKIVGIVEYSIDNPWNKIMFDTIYSENEETNKFIIDYTKKRILKLNDII